MEKSTLGGIYAAVMTIVIVGLDLAFFKHHSGQRLIANIGVALLSAAFFWRFAKD